MTPAQLEEIAAKLAVRFDRPIEHCRAQVRFLIADVLSALGNKRAAEKYLAEVGIN